MRNKPTQITLAAIFGLALAFTFSCSSDSNPGGESSSSEDSSSSVPDEQKSSSSDESSSSGQSNDLCIINGQLSNICPNGSSSSEYVSSSSSYPEGLSSSGDGDSSSSGDGNSSSSVADASSSSSIESSSSAVVSSSSVPPSSSSILPSSSSFAGGTFVDERDGKTYKWVEIGTQNWMAENLNFDAAGSKCYTNSDPNCATYGRLYNWSTIMDASPSSAALPSGVKGICPAGWHLPSDPEWAILINYVGSTAVTQLKANSALWATNTGTDRYGFSALPGGYGSSDGSFSGTSNYGYWWSASEYNASNAYVRYIYYSNTGVSRSYYNKGNFYSVRCLQDSSSSSILPSSSSFAGSVAFVDERDGKTYNSVEIGTQTWMAENLNYAVPGSKCYTNSDPNCATYGRLYNWSTAMDASPSSAALPSGVKGICPAGWHLPSDGEWGTLIDYVNSTVATQLKANSALWATNTGTDRYGFSALPGGYGSSDGSFSGTSNYGYWWSASEYNASNAYIRYIYYDNTGVSRSYYNKGNFYSVRCILD